jgi:hypothetical protein
MPSIVIPAVSPTAEPEHLDIVDDFQVIDRCAEYTAMADRRRLCVVVHHHTGSHQRRGERRHDKLTPHCCLPKGPTLTIRGNCCTRAERLMQIPRWWTVT